MASHAFILFASDTAWRACAWVEGKPTFIDVATLADATPRQRAEKISAALETAGYAGQGTILAVPSSWCYAASIAVDDLPKNDRKAMVYRLEEKLPLAAESFIADFVSMPEPAQKALGISISTDLVKDLVDALEAEGVAVQAITPTVLLAAQGLPAVDGQDPYVLLCGEESGDKSQMSLVAIENGKPVSWALLSADVTDVKLQLELVALVAEGSPHVEACGIDPNLVDELTEATGLIVTIREDAVADAAARCGAEVVAGRQRPWIDFRRGPLAIADPLRLHRRPLNAVLAAAAVLLVVFAGVMIYRGARYEHAARAADAQMAEAFRKQFPGFPMPANVRAVVESEYSKARVRAGGSLPADATRTALQTLHDVLDKLPAEGRFTIDRAMFDDQGFQIEGRLRSYEDVDAIASAARKAGMNVDAPQARKDAQGLWNFTLHGTRPAKSGSAVATGSS